uniref:Transposase n=1 Tax=Globodera rostochiensis TaxID=31243 RepID=A0A914HNL9_GLORO
MSITKSTDRTPKLDKLNPIQLISLDKLNPIQLISLDKLNPIQLIGIFLSQNKTVAKELGLSDRTISRWKKELGQTTPNKYSDSEQKELMKRYYEIKGQNPKISDEDIAKMLKIGKVTLFRWKKEFERQQMHPNSVDGHSVEVNASGSNVHQIGNSNLGSI